MALLELLAGATPAGVVAAGLLVLVEPAGLHHRERVDRLLVLRLDRDRAAGRRRDRLAPLGGMAAGVVERRGRVLPSAPAWARLLLPLGLHGHLDVEDVARELVPDVVHQLR